MLMTTFTKLFLIAVTAIILITAVLILTAKAGLDPLAMWIGAGGIFLIVAAWLLGGKE